MTVHAPRLSTHPHELDISPTQAEVRLCHSSECRSDALRGARRPVVKQASARARSARRRALCRDSLACLTCRGITLDLRACCGPSVLLAVRGDGWSSATPHPAPVPSGGSAQPEAAMIVVTAALLLLVALCSAAGTRMLAWCAPNLQTFPIPGRSVALPSLHACATQRFGSPAERSQGLVRVACRHCDVAPRATGSAAAPGAVI